MNIKRYIKVFLAVVISIIILFKYQEISRPIEELNIPVGIGIDVEELANGVVLKKVPISSYVFQQEQQLSSKVHVGESYTIAQARGDRQNKSNQKFTLGQEKIYLAGEESARFGLREILEVTFSSPLVGDTGYNIVCKGKAEDILRHNVKGYPSSSDYIFGMIDNLKFYNFFGENYKIIDSYLKMDAEGKSIVMPYLELKNSKLEVTGMAIFDDDKMVNKLDMNETRALNILREKDSRGVISLQENDKGSTSIYSMIKRKVKCYKIDGTYKFIVNLDIKGELISNQIESYKNITKDPLVKEKAEENLAIQVEEMCNDFIKKVQNEYKIDVFEFGSIAVAKYGRQKGIDWNKAISEADIEVNVNVDILKFGRGDY